VDPAADYGLVAGFTSAADQFSHVWLDRDEGTLTAASWADGVAVAHKAVLASERLYLQPAGQPVRALERYGSALGREMEALPVPGVTSGWCSWYYYFQGISEAEVLANLEHIAANRQTLPFEYVQIDDGYQSEIGDWLTPNEKFPHGMKWIADEIHARGYKAGLWLAPFLAGAKSKLFAEHPDWFVRYSTGGPAIATLNWGQLCYALDLTHPEVLAWLETVFRTVCDEWGYDYVKIDFIYAGAVDGVRHDPNVTRAQAYRRGVSAIRDTVGSRFILACGNPMGPSVGLVEGARIGPDVAPYWRPFDRGAPQLSLSDPSALNSIRNTIARFWMHGRLWASDPDCLLVRETDTAMAGDEVRALATVIGLSGGMVLDSDKLPKLSEERGELISLLLPVYGKAAVPLDLFQTPELPAILSLDCGTHTLLGVFNWGDESGEVTAKLPEGRWHIFELWQREYLGVCEGTLTLPAPPHGCRLLRLTPDLGRPQVVGSTLHFTMGAMEITSEEWDGRRLRVGLRPVARRNGDLYVVRDGRVQAVRVEALSEERVIEV
jgi:alpha-galactosidase